MKVDELQGNNKIPILINDLQSALVTLWPDSVSVDVTELVESMLQEGNLRNGGGSFSFLPQADGVYVTFSS